MGYDQHLKVAERVQAAFTKEGVDFEELTNSIGGLEELPVKGD